VLYRSYGLLLLIIAVLIMSQGFRDQRALGMMIGGAVLFIDLPLRLLGQIVPWRDDCVVHWYASPYRGSHIFFIPTWLFGAGFLLVSAAAFALPGFEKKLDDVANFRLKQEAPPPKAIDPPTPPPPKVQGELELKIEPTAPFSNTTFRWIVMNRTGGRVTDVKMLIQYKGAFDPESRTGINGTDLFPLESREGDIRVIGSPADWVRVSVIGTGANGKAINVEKTWHVEKK
jgi:hypothetical protein